MATFALTDPGTFARTSGVTLENKLKESLVAELCVSQGMHATSAVGANVENLVLTGTAAIDATGNSLANSLTVKPQVRRSGRRGRFR